MTGASGDVKSRILHTLQKKPMSVSELARQLKVRREFVTGYLESMRHDGDVEVVTVGRSNVYRPKKK
jgi:predicted ArsR family transcriptional regulator